jgi:hypothetical protein
MLIIRADFVFIDAQTTLDLMEHLEITILIHVYIDALLEVLETGKHHIDIVLKFALLEHLLMNLVKLVFLFALLVLHTLASV